MSKLDKNKIDKWIEPVLGLIALAAYGLTLSSGAYPGESASLIVQYTGLFPRMTPLHPLWGSLVWAISKVPLGGLALRLNISSVLCSAVSIWLLYEIVTGTVYGAIKVNDRNKIRAKIAARLAGTTSAMFLAFCIPFWIVSNRAHPASFDVLLLLIVTRLFLLYAETLSRPFVLLFALLYGLGIVEFTTFLPFAPLFAFYVLLLLWRHDRLKMSLITSIALCVIGGLLLYFIAAWRFYGSAGYELRGYANYFQILWFMWRDQYFLITRSLPQVGWLIILFMTVVPWLVSLLVAGKALNDERDWTYYVLHVVLTVLAIGVLFNLKFAPWSILGPGRLLVTPYVLTALLFGYLVAYWFLLPTNWWRDSEKPVKMWIRKWLGTIVIIPGIILLCVAPFRNFSETDGRPARFVNWYAREIVKSLEGRSWLITDGNLDNNLLIAAHDLGCPLRILNLLAGDNDIYTKYVVTLFEKPRLKNLAQIGLLPLLQEWFELEAGIEKKVAVMWPADLWLGAGFTAVPHKLIFLGTKNPDDLDPTRLLADHERFWTEMATAMKEAGQETGFLSGFGKYLLRHMGMVANNLGVLMEDLGCQDKAFRTYSKAREIDPNNVSTLLNLNVMLEKGFATERAKSIKKDLDKLAANTEARYHIWSLSRYYGYVRAPEAFAQLGWVWALSGQPGMAVSGLKKALDLLPDKRKGSIKQRLADVYMLQQEDEESEVLYHEVLMENPDNGGALVGLARLASRKGDFKQAKELLEKAEQTGVPKVNMALEWAALHWVAGNAGQSRIILEELVELNPDEMRAWAMLVGMLVQQKDESGLQKCIARMQKLKVGQGYILLVAKSYLALIQNEWDTAREHLEEALALSPNNTQVLELLLRLDMFQDREGLAMSHARKLLRMDPGNALGNHVLGSIQLKNREYVLAEDSFRKSLEREKSAGVLNDLAWLLQEKGLHAEAEQLVRTALEMTGKMPEAWDTLGVILMKTDRLEEAENAFEHSMFIFHDDLRVFVHMLELQAMKGNKEKALELADMLSKKWDQLSFAEQKKVESIRQKIEVVASP